MNYMELIVRFLKSLARYINALEARIDHQADLYEKLAANQEVINTYLRILVSNMNSAPPPADDPQPPERR